MKRGSTILLRAAVTIIGLAVLALCVITLPILITEPGVGGYRPILIGLYVPAIPFYFALYQAFKLLSYIDKNTAFSELSVKSLKNIKYCGNIISLIFVAGMPYLFHMAQKDDAPGVVVLGLVIIFASSVISIFAVVLQRLLQNAIDIKSENDLTV